MKRVMSAMETRALERGCSLGRPTVDRCGYVLFELWSMEEASGGDLVISPASE